MHFTFRCAAGCIIGTIRRCIAARSQIDGASRAKVVARIAAGMQEQNGVGDKTFVCRKKVGVALLDKTR